jgi:hypothetical protein
MLRSKKGSDKINQVFDYISEKTLLALASCEPIGQIDESKKISTTLTGCSKYSRNKSIKPINTRYRSRKRLKLQKRFQRE